MSLKRDKGGVWAKGTSGNPAGRPPRNFEGKKISKMDSESLTNILCKYMDMTLPELQDALKSKNTPAKELIVVSALKYAIEKGDKGSRDFLIERLYGPMPKEIKVEQKSMHYHIMDYLKSKDE